jgi:SAM-dependent methyltransferase
VSPASIEYLRCPACGGEIAPASCALCCIECHRAFPFDNGIPLFLEHDTPKVRETIVALDAEMAWYPLVLTVIALLARIWLPAERRRLIGHIGLCPGGMVLDHCTARGRNLPAIASAIGSSGKLVAMDLSGAMVQETRRFARRKNMTVDIHQADALNLPYADACFDAVVHYGAINQFEDRQRQVIDEMVRVTKSGGTIAILDEGIELGKETTWWAKLLIRRNGLFASQPPLELLPKGVEPHVEWVLRGLFYQIVFRKPLH